MNTQPFTLERTYDAPARQIWKALTEPALMKQWYFDVPEFRPVVGTAFEFSGGSEEKTYRHLCVVTDVEEGRKIAYSWRYDGYEGNSIVTFELFPEGEKTRLKLTHEGIETFPAERDFAASSFAAGWTSITGELLPAFLAAPFIRHEVTLPGDASKIWAILTDPTSVKTWAEGFGAGTYAQTDWQKGSEISWMNAKDEVVVKGLIEESIPGKLLRTRYFDDTQQAAPSDPGSFVEEYTLSEREGTTILKIVAGPLSIDDASFMAPMWENAIERIKKLSQA